MLALDIANILIIISAVTLLASITGYIYNNTKRTINNTTTDIPIPAPRQTTDASFKIDLDTNIMTFYGTQIDGEQVVGSGYTDYTYIIKKNNIENVVIAEGVTVISEGAFRFFVGLNYAHLPKSLRRLVDQYFR